MKGKDLLQALDQVDERFVEEAEAPLGRGSNRGFFWIAAAACLLLVFVSAMLLPWGQDPPKKTGYPAGVQLSNETLAHAGSSDGAIPTLAPADMDPCSPADYGVNGGTMEQPSVILEITQWTPDGPEALVIGLPDTRQIPLGTSVKVAFSQDCNIAIGNGGGNYQIQDGSPEPSNYPPGSQMLVLFTGYENGVLYVNMVYPGGIE